MKIRRIVLMFVVFGAFPLSAFAYSDRVDASPQEIYDAAKIAFSKEGIYKENPDKKSLSTRWVYERIRRSRKRRFVPIQLKENVDLRYQMQIEIEGGRNYSEVSVVGRFEEKATDAAPQQSWKYSYSSKELYFKEREAFMKILNSLEAKKKSAVVTAAQPS